MSHDPREELRRRLGSGELPSADAQRALAVIDEREDDLAALRAAERRGTYTWEESRAVVDALGVPESEVAAMMIRLGLEPDQAVSGVPGAPGGARVCDRSTAVPLRGEAAADYTGGMTDRDPREELRLRLDAGDISTADAEEVLATLAERKAELEADRAALRAAENPGTMTPEETARVVDSWGIDDAIEDMMRRLGLENATR